MLCEFGHVASSRELLERGLSRYEIQRLADRPDVMKPRRGILACAHLSALERYSLGNRARLACVTVLREKKIWAGEERRTHLHLPASGHLPTDKRAKPPGLPRSAGHGPQDAPDRVHFDPRPVVWHWGAAQFDTRLRVTTKSALLQAMACLPPDDVVAALESALHLGEIGQREFEQIIEEAPRRLGRVLSEAEPGAQSGVETHVRLRLRRAGYRVQPQVFIPGVGHVDNLVEDIVAVDTDGRAFHAETFEEDRRRDLGTEWIGLRSLRIPASYVFTEWDWVSETIARMVQEGLAVRRAWSR